MQNKVLKQIRKYQSIYFSNKQAKLEAGAQGKSKKYVLMFHQIIDDMSMAYNQDFAISTVSFLNLIEELSKVTNFITLEDVLDDKVDSGVFLTFDDAFEGVYTRAFNVLKEKNIEFAVFQAIEKLDKPLWLTKAQLLELSEYNGCTIGAHTISHPHLGGLSNRESKMEVIGGGLLLAEIIGKPVDVLAYPYGSCFDIRGREIRYAKQEYKLAFSTLQSCIPKDADRFFLPRVNVCEAVTGNILEMISE